ncbi:uncharacterized protein LOC122000220 [Zingiber officinale]|uniref:uncharacterized protein LOC122000220 n=1 Tax=Zingiber officinale TaxID=94328 RepID=UPI001C4B773A|nr:uncharacterized protein LOC122000220 [Zingiber officinale]
MSFSGFVRDLSLCASHSSQRSGRGGGDTKCNPSSQIRLLALTLAAFPPQCLLGLPDLCFSQFSWSESLSLWSNHQSAKEQRWVCNELGLVSYLGSKAMASSKDDVDQPTDSYSLQVFSSQFSMI